MGRYDKAFEELAKETWLNQQQVHDLEQYVQTGDINSLNQLAAGPGLSVSWMLSRVAKYLPYPDSLDDIDMRVLNVAATYSYWDVVGKWLKERLQRETPDSDFAGSCFQTLRSLGATEEQLETVLSFCLNSLTKSGKPTSAGRYLVSLSDSDLLRLCGREQFEVEQLFTFVCRFMPDKALQILGDLLNGGHWSMAAYPRIAVRELGDACIPILEKRLSRNTDGLVRFQIGKTLAAHDFHRYGRTVLDICREILKEDKPDIRSDVVWEWMIDGFGGEVLPELRSYMQPEGSRQQSALFSKIKSIFSQEIPIDEPPAYTQPERDILAKAVAVYGKDAADIVLSKLNSKAEETRFEALGHLIAIDDGTYRETLNREIRQALESSVRITPAEETKRTQGLKLLEDRGTPQERIDMVTKSWVDWDRQEIPARVKKYVHLATRWDTSAVEDILWEFTRHEFKQIRAAAIEALSTLGDRILPQAESMINDKNADIRLQAISLLKNIGTPKAHSILEDRLNKETNANVKQEILMALQKAYKDSGRKYSREEVEEAALAELPNLKLPSVPWLKIEQLPQLKYNDGDPVLPEILRYLICLQFNWNEMSEHVQLIPLYSLIDRSSSGDFAYQVLSSFVAHNGDVKTKPALTIAGLLGDDRVVPVIDGLVKTWAESKHRGRAEYAVQALGMIASDRALLALDAISVRFHKLRNVSEAAIEAFRSAADAQGVTPEELGDRVIPSLGFEPGKPRVLEGGNRQIEVRIGPDFKLKYFDLQKNKPVGSLPTALGDSVKSEFKDLSARLREAAKFQVVRMEQMMVQQRRWPIDKWKELFLGNPIMVPFGMRLVWGTYDKSGKLSGTFRTLDDGTLTNLQDEKVLLDDKYTIGVLHPLEVNKEVRSAWLDHMVDYDIETPFLQLDRPIAQLSADDAQSKLCKAFSGHTMNAMTFKGRVDRLRWRRGYVGDGGMVAYYWKRFPTAGIDAFVGTFVPVASDMYSECELAEVYFAEMGSLGMDNYHDLSEDRNSSLITLGDLPPIVYSEVMGDMERITLKRDES